MTRHTGKPLVRGEPRTIPGLVSPEADVGFTKDLWTVKAPLPVLRVNYLRNAW